MIEEEESQPSRRPAPMGRIGAFTGSIGDWSNLRINPPQAVKKSSLEEPKYGKSPEKESLATTSEGSAPQVSSSEAAPPKKDQEEPSNPTQGEGGSSSASQAAPAGTSASAVPQNPKSSSSEQKKPEEKAVEEPALRKLNRRRKPTEKPRQETEEERAERERLEKIADDAAKLKADELIAQEEHDKKKLSEKDAKAKQAAAANTERARDAAERMKKKKEAAKTDEKPSRAVTRRMKKVPEGEDGDPPGDDQTPWTIFTYRQPRKVRSDYTYDGVSITNKMSVIDPQYIVNTKTKVWGRPRSIKPIEAVLFLQRRQAFAGAKHRIRDVRSVQIERAFTNPLSLFPTGHMCNTKDGKSVLVRVSTPYSTEGELLLRTLPGEAPTRYNLAKVMTIQHLKLEADFKDSKSIAPVAHCAMHFATRAIGYKLKEGKVSDRPTWFTPEVLRTARVFIKEVSSGQYTNEDHTEAKTPAFVCHPSVLTNFAEEPGKGRFVHLISVGLQLAQVKWMSTKQLPFYVRGLLRAVPAELLPEVFTIATITDPDVEVCVDHHLMLWARVKNWDDYRPIVDGRYLGITYEETFQEPLATIVVSQLELAEAFLDQKDEGQAIPHVDEYEDMEDESGAIRAPEAPSIKTKPDPKKRAQRQASASPGKPGGGTRAAYLMPAYRYPIAVPGAHHPAKPEHYSVIINVKRAVQYGAAFSVAVDKEKEIRGSYVTSGIPANAIVQIRTSIGQCVNHNSLGTSDWEYLSGREVHPTDPTIRISGRSEMPSLEIYHEDLSSQELKVWNHSIIDAQQFSEDYMDELLSDRALDKGLPPTNLSYVEFVGMRVKTLSFLSFKNEQKEYDIFLPGKTPDVLLDTEKDRGSDSNDEGIPVKGKGKGKGKVKVKINKRERAREKENSIQPLFIQMILIQ